MNGLAAFIMRGRVPAMSVAAVLALVSLFLPPVSIVSTATVALVTLRLGAYEGLWVLVCSGLVAGLLGWFLSGSPQFALLYALMFWLPVWLISVVLREGRHLALAIETTALVGAVGVLGYYLYNPEAASVWQGLLMPMLPEEIRVDAEPKIVVIARYMTGVATAGTVTSLVFGLFLGRWWQANLYNPGGFKQEFLALTCHPPVTLVSIGVLLVAIISRGLVSEIAWNAVIVLFVLYALVGSAVMHTVFASMKLAKYAVPMFYITLFLIPHAILPVALIGLSDSWLNLRKKHSKSNTH